jgi:IclR family transcriptional regulator, pca regulon regulatory protein
LESIADFSRFEGDPEFMMSLARGLAILRLLVDSGRPISIAEASRRTGMSRAAAKRCLYTLGALGYVAQEAKGFSTSTSALSLGRSFVSSSSLAGRAQPLLDALRDELGESCSLGILDDDYVRYIGRAETARIISINLRVGSRLPLYATSMGRVLLTSLPSARLASYLERVSLKPLTPMTQTDPEILRDIISTVAREGFSIVDQELEIGLRSVSVPVRNRSGIVAAINVGTAAPRVSLPDIHNRILPALQCVSAQLNTDRS